MCKVRPVQNNDRPMANGGFMKTMLVSLSLLLVSTIATADQTQKYFEFGNPVVEEITSGPLTEIQTDFTSTACQATVAEATLDPLNPIDRAHIYLDKVINLGKKLWSVVELGRPVVNINVDSANALPQGVLCWNTLTGWRAPESKVYRVFYTNGFGSRVVDFSFRVIYTTGGTFNGQGQYITNATVVPANLEVSWGYTFNANTVVPSVFNSGTVERPVAGMQLNLNWSVDTVIKHSQQAETFYVGGDGSFKKLN